MKRLFTIFLTLSFLTTVASVSFGQKGDDSKKTDKKNGKHYKNKQKKTEATKKS